MTASISFVCGGSARNAGVHRTVTSVPPRTRGVEARQAEQRAEAKASRAELFEQDQRKAAEREAAERAHEEL